MWRPSWDHEGERWPPAGLPKRVSWRRPVPSFRTTHSTDCDAIPPASDVKTSSSPRGDQSGSDPNSTTCCGTPPVDCTIQMPPRLREWYAIH